MPVVIGAQPDSTFDDPVGLLCDCHRRIESFLSVLSHVSRRGPLTAEERASFEAALQYFRESAPKHTADEEESLFPRLRATTAAQFKAGLAQIDALEEDHIRASSLHDEIDRIGRRWLESNQLSSAEADQFSTLVEELVQLYSVHIEIEERDIFPMATVALDPADRTAIGAEMALRRGLNRV
jgi:hemerythrin-like domain-containing protein